MNVLRRPTYSSTIGVEREKWLADNDEDIRSWYVATSEAVPEEHFADYREFSLVQYDIARDLDERLHDGMYEAALRDADNDDEPWEEAR